MLRQNQFQDHSENVAERRKSLTEEDARHKLEEMNKLEAKQAKAVELKEEHIKEKRNSAHKSNEQVNETRMRHELDSKIDESGAKRELKDHIKHHELVNANRKDYLDGKIERIRDLE